MKRRSLEAEVRSGLKPTWQHPVTPAQGFELLTWWLEHNDGHKALTAELLGIDLRTLQRWLQTCRVPLSTAVLLDQLRSGPVFPTSVFRGVIRHSWRDYLQTKFEHLRTRQRSQLPAKWVSGWTFEEMAAGPDERSKYWREKRRERRAERVKYWREREIQALRAASGTSGPVVAPSQSSSRRGVSGSGSVKS